MKSNQTLRILSLVGFLLLIAPFYQQCNKAEAPAEEVAVDTTAIETPSFEKNKSILEINKTEDSIIHQEKVKFSNFQKAYNLIDDGGNENAFELSLKIGIFFEKPYKKFGEYDCLDLLILIRSLSFIFIVIISFGLLILSFTRKTKWIYKLSKLNLFLIIVTVICTLLFDPLFETYKQIKWGYYVFTFVQIVICYISKLNSKKKSVSS